MYALTPNYRTFLAAFFIAAALISCKKEDIPENTNAPAAHIAASEKLQVPEAVDLPGYLPGYSRVATYYATGVQKYKAKEKAGQPLTYEWVFVAPEANLYDISNAKAGTHGAGPFWQLSATDSIFAQPFTPARTAPAADGTSIDWLLLMPKAGSIPTGIFAGVDYIQRIATRGGKAPSIPPTSANQTTAVEYEAVYRFSKKN